MAQLSRFVPGNAERDVAKNGRGAADALIPDKAIPAQARRIVSRMIDKPHRRAALRIMATVRGPE